MRGLWLKSSQSPDKYLVDLSYILLSAQSGAQGLHSLRRHCLIGIRIPIINLRRSSDRLRLIMVIPQHIRRCLFSNKGPNFFSFNLHLQNILQGDLLAKHVKHEWPLLSLWQSSGDFRFNIYFMKICDMNFVMTMVQMNSHHLVNSMLKLISLGKIGWGRCN